MMGSFIASVLGFAFGLLLLPTMFRGVRVGGMAEALKAGLVCGVLSALLGKSLVMLLSLVFLLPILLLGPLGPFVIHGLVNGLLLSMAARVVRGIEFDGRRTLVWAAFALTLCQSVVRSLV